MKKRMVLMGLVLGVAVSGAQAAWMDNFDSYTAGTALSTPWVTSNLYVTNVNSASTPNAIVDANRTYGASGYRASDTAGASTLTASLCGAGESQHYAGIGLRVNATLPTSASAGFNFQTDEWGVINQLQFVTKTGYEGGTTGSTTVRPSANTWYDVKTSVYQDSGNWYANAWYKQTTSNTWIAMTYTSGTDTMDDFYLGTDFQPTYVWVTSGGYGYIDNVTIVPEPMTLMMVLAGGLAGLGRKKYGF